MTYQDRVSAACAAIEKHNSSVSTEKHEIDFEKFLEKLEELGGTSEEALSECAWEDLEKCGLPRILARIVAKIFRDRKEDSYISAKKAEMMSSEDLLKLYDPRENNAVSKRLKEICNEQPFIVFDSTGKVFVTESNQLLQHLKRGFEPLKICMIMGQPYKVHPVGKLPDSDLLAMENPLFPGEPLRPDETCGRTGRSWKGIPKRLRRILYLAIQTREIKIDTNMHVHDTFQILIETDAEEELAVRCPKAALKFRELEEIGQLPSLLVKIGDKKMGSNDPFYKEHVTT